MKHWIFLSLLGGVALSLHALAAPPAGFPQPQLTLPCVFVSAIDGDTVDVDVTIRVRVRLLACWAPEMNAPGGKSAADSLSLAIAGNGGNKSKGVIQLPIKSNRLADLFTFGRVLGNCYVDGQEKSLGEQQVALGLASTTKGGKLGE